MGVAWATTGSCWQLWTVCGVRWWATPLWRTFSSRVKVASSSWISSGYVRCPTGSPHAVPMPAPTFIIAYPPAQVCPGTMQGLTLGVIVDLCENPKVILLLGGLINSPGGLSLLDDNPDVSFSHRPSPTLWLGKGWIIAPPGRCLPGYGAQMRAIWMCPGGTSTPWPGACSH